MCCGPPIRHHFSSFLSCRIEVCVFWVPAFSCPQLAHQLGEKIGKLAFVPKSRGSVVKGGVGGMRGRVRQKPRGRGGKCTVPRTRQTSWRLQLSHFLGEWP